MASRQRADFSERFWHLTFLSQNPKERSDIGVKMRCRPGPRSCESIPHRDGDQANQCKRYQVHGHAALAVNPPIRPDSAIQKNKYAA